jgi:hypothetical protein
MAAQRYDHSVIIRKMPWLLRFTRLRGATRGYCFLPEPHRGKTKRQYEILVHRGPGSNGRLELDTLIHEVTHASFPDAAEEHVHEAASDLARILWDLGYRRTEG